MRGRLSSGKYNVSLVSASLSHAYLFSASPFFVRHGLDFTSPFFVRHGLDFTSPFFV
jgi:hypothetical protein